MQQLCAHSRPTVMVHAPSQALTSFRHLATAYTETVDGACAADFIEARRAVAHRSDHAHALADRRRVAAAADRAEAGHRESALPAHPSLLVAHPHSSRSAPVPSVRAGVSCAFSREHRDTGWLTTLAIRAHVASPCPRQPGTYKFVHNHKDGPSAKLSQLGGPGPPSNPCCTATALGSWPPSVGPSTRQPSQYPAPAGRTPGPPPYSMWSGW